MRKTRILAPMIGAVALLMAGAQSPSSAQEIKLKFGTIHSGKTSSGKALADVFIPKLKEYSGGRIGVDIHWAASLCAEHACGEQMRLGQIDIATTSTANFGAFATTYSITDLPYLMKDTDSAKKLALGWFGKELHARALKDSGFKVFGLAPGGGYRQLSQSERVVRTPADMKGLKFRVTKSPVESTLIKAWGGAPIPYNWPQLYQGIQTGVLHGSYIPIPWLVLGKTYEVAPYFTFVGGAFGGTVIYMDAKRFDRLPAWAQEAVTKTMDDAVRAFFEFDATWIAESYDVLKAKAKLYHPNEAELKLWRAGAVDAWIAAKGTFDPALARRVLEAQGMNDYVKVLDAKGALK